MRIVAYEVESAHCKALGEPARANMNKDSFFSFYRALLTHRVGEQEAETECSALSARIEQDTSIVGVRLVLSGLCLVCGQTEGKPSYELQINTKSAGTSAR